MSGTVVRRGAGVAHRHQMGGSGGRADVGEIQETLHVPPRRPAHGRKPRVVPVGVHGLLVIGDAGVLGRHPGLIDADVDAVERPRPRSPRSRGGRRAGSAPPSPGTGTRPPSGAGRVGSRGRRVARETRRRVPGGRAGARSPPPGRRGTRPAGGTGHGDPRWRRRSPRPGRGPRGGPIRAPSTWRLPRRRPAVPPFTCSFRPDRCRHRAPQDRSPERGTAIALGARCGELPIHAAVVPALSLGPVTKGAPRVTRWVRASDG